MLRRILKFKFVLSSEKYYMIILPNYVYISLDLSKNLKSLFKNPLKGIVSRDFGGLQMILVNRIVVPDVLLDVYLFLNFRFHVVF